MERGTEFAGQELKRYYSKVTGREDCEILLSLDPALFEGKRRRDFDPKLDDAYLVDVERGRGKISGVNGRSLLQGVYKFFTLIGCRFLRPSEQGERIEKRSPEECSARCEGMPPLRHRGITIEGAVSRENLLDMIDFAPKLGFNAYFTQFRDSYEFFQRWYEHERNPIKGKETFTKSDALRILKEADEEIAKRGMVRHAVGHGWTCEAVGYPSGGWHKFPEDGISPEVKSCLAEIAGERSFFKGVPLNTNLCYSNPDVREKLVSEVVRYCKSHPNVDALHFWLADNYNNFCECPACRKRSQTDHYLRLLNELDERLTAEGLPVRIVFLIYFELLQPPAEEKLEGDRFIMMFAPISRTYTRSYAEDTDLAEARSRAPKIFPLNQFVTSDSPADNLAYLFEWQKHFSGDSFLFDYHLMWDVDKDYAGMRLAKVIFDDVRSLPELGLGGLVSCQQQRVFFPTGFAMYTMGRALSDPDVAFETLRAEYFSAAYGENGFRISEILIGLSEKFSFEYVRAERPMLDASLAERFGKLAEELVSLRSEAETLRTSAFEGFVRENFGYLILFLELAQKLAGILAKKSSGALVKNLDTDYNEIRDFVFSKEDETQKLWDTMYFDMIVGDMVRAQW